MDYKKILTGSFIALAGAVLTVAALNTIEYTSIMFIAVLMGVMTTLIGIGSVARTMQGKKAALIIGILAFAVLLAGVTGTSDAVLLVFGK